MPLGAVPFPFGICRICRDKATGLHYGVATCEGCKGFFKRNIAKGETFKCHFGGSCELTPKTRSHCKACRFKRCLETGMSVQGVRMGRVPKTEKDKVLEAFKDEGSNFNNHELVLQRLGSGNYKFELNKTDTVTNSTCTSAKNSVSSVATAVCAVENNVASRGHTVAETNAELSREPSLRTEAALSNIKEIATDYQEKSTNSFTTSNEKLYDTKCHYLDQTANSCIKTEAESEKCDNPFDDTYAVKTALHEQETLVRQPKQPYESKTNQSMCFGDPDKYEHGIVMPYTSQGAAASAQFKYISTGEEAPQHTKSFDAYNECLKIDRERTSKNVPMCKTETHTGECSTKSQCAAKPVTCFDVQGCSYDSEDHALRKRNSFSPALINVLLEQVLDSNEAVHVIAEKIQQRQLQGNLSQSCAQNLSQRISALSAKRQKSSDDDSSIYCQTEQNLDSAQPHSAVGDVESVRNQHISNRPAVCSHLHRDAKETGPSFCSCAISKFDETRYNEYGSRFGEPLPKVSKTELPPKGSMVSSGIVSSSLTSEEEESKIQTLKDSLDGIDIGMKILNRLKPEHREKIRQYKLGKLRIRKMTGSDEDVKETYSKVIDAIPSLNERILGFCNSVPGFSDIAKEDKDVLMKRAYYDIWMLSSSEYFQEGESYMILETGEFYTQQTMRKILNDYMVDKIFEFTNQFNSLGLTDLEMAILCAVRLTATDELELFDRQQIAKLHSHMLDVFVFEVEKNHETAHARKLIDTFRLMPLLEVVNRIQREIIAKYSV